MRGEPDACVHAWRACTQVAAHVAEIKQSVDELAALEWRAQTSYLKLLKRTWG